MDIQTLTNLVQTLVNIGIEADEYTHVRPSVRIEEATTAAKDLKASINQLNRLIRLIKAHASYLEESS
jgi:endonuclease IV